MDEVDFRILAHLFEKPLAGPQALAGSVGLTRNAVAQRLGKLEAGPLALRFFALPHQSLFGRHSLVHLFHVETPVDVEAVLRTDDVIGYDVNHDGLCAVTTWSLPGAPNRLERVMGSRPLASFSDATPGPATPHLNRLEWKVAAAWLRQPRASAAQLARATGLAARTCTRARQRLVASNAVRVGINLREDRARFPIFRVYVQGSPDETAVRRILGPDAACSDVVAEGTVHFARAASTGAIVHTVQRLQRLPGVSDVKLILSQDNGIAIDRIAAWCLANVADRPAPRTESPADPLEPPVRGGPRPRRP